MPFFLVSLSVVTMDFNENFEVNKCFKSFLWGFVLFPWRNYFIFSSQCCKSNFTLKKGYLMSNIWAVLANIQQNLHGRAPLRGQKRCLSSSFSDPSYFCIPFQPGKDGPMLPILCFFRIIFLPLFAFCNALPRSNSPVFFHEDYFPIVFMVLFAISNGYLGSLCMMYGPS